MVLTHMAVGAALGTLVDGRGAALALGAASHVPLDVVPHYEFEKMWVEVAAVIILAGLFVLSGHAGTPVFFGAVGAAAPDVENLLWRRGVLPGRWKLFPGHSSRLSRVIPHGRALPLRHAWWQAAVIVASGAIALRGLGLGGGTTGHGVSP